MKKILLLLVGSITAFAGPTATFASDSSSSWWSDYPFKTYGRCNAWLRWHIDVYRQTGRDTDIQLVCEQGEDGLWYLVAG